MGSVNSLTATGSTSSGVTWTTACPSNADLFLQVSALQLNSETWLINNLVKWRFTKSRHNINKQNQQQQALLLRYFCTPIKEDEHHLWLAVDSLNNLAALETFAL